MRLKRVDLPTFGLPTIATTGLAKISSPKKHSVINKQQHLQNLNLKKQYFMHIKVYLLPLKIAINILEIAGAGIRVGFLGIHPLKPFNPVNLLIVIHAVIYILPQIHSKLTISIYKHLGFSRIVYDHINQLAWPRNSSHCYF